MELSLLLPFMTWGSSFSHTVLIIGVHLGGVSVKTVGGVRVRVGRRASALEGTVHG